MIRRVLLVDGPLAFRMGRFQAAQANEVGLEVLTLPLLASRLAGGFRRQRRAVEHGAAGGLAATLRRTKSASITGALQELLPELVGSYGAALWNFGTGREVGADFR